MKRILIVNADDCNLTPGVTEAILNCHDQGIVSSTTWMVNLETKSAAVREVMQRKRLGVGIHLNMTLGRPVSPLKKIKTLVGAQGQFKKRDGQLGNLPRENEVALEYESQIQLFQKIFGRRPTHLDTHHQMHDFPLFFRALTQVAARFHLPIRRSRLMLAAQKNNFWKTTDFFFGNFTSEGYWRGETLTNLLPHLPEGVSEIMCHPGCNDKTLRAISSFTAGRQEELKLFRSPHLQSILKACDVVLAHF